MPRPIAKDHGDKRSHILTVAAKVFAEQGFARASMAQVAEACGISKANIYHYCESKDALLFEILESYLSELRDRIIGLDTTGTPAEQQLFLVTREILRAYEGMDHEHQIQSEGIPLLPARQQAILKGYQREMVARMGEIVESAAPKVFEGQPKKLRSTVMSVFGMLNWFYMWNRDADIQTRDAYAELVANLTLNGIRSL